MVFVAPLLIYLIVRVVLHVVPARLDRPIVRAGVVSLFVLVYSVTQVVIGQIDHALHLPVAVATVAMTAGLGCSLLLKTQINWMQDNGKKE